MSATRAGLVALATASVLIGQEQPARSMRFFDAGWDNAHSAAAGRVARIVFDEVVASPASYVSDFVFRPADHCADATTEGAGAEFIGETIGFPLELFGSGEHACQTIVGTTFPADFEDALAIDRVFGCRLLRLGVEHSVGVGVHRDADGDILAFAHEPRVGTQTATAKVVAAEIDAILPAADPGFLAGWQRSHVDGGLESLPEPLRSVAKASPSIAVIEPIEARVEESFFAADGTVAARFAFGLRGAVAADGRFAFERVAEHRDEQDAIQTVTTELSCDLRAIYCGVKGWPIRCVWSREHPQVVEVLRSQAAAVLPLIGWARDPYWISPSSTARWAADPDDVPIGGARHAVTRVEQRWPGTGLGGVLRWVVDEAVEPPRVLTLTVERDTGTPWLVTEFGDERELAPGFRRPMRITTRWYPRAELTPARERVVEITAVRIATGHSVSSWRLAPRGARYRVMR